MNKILLFMLLVCLIPHPVYAADSHLMAQIIMCESSGRLYVWGDGHKAYGPVQFHKATFNELKKKAHMEYLKWKNPHDQIVLMSWAIDHGYGNKWTCYRKIMRNRK